MPRNTASSKKRLVRYHYEQMWASWTNIHWGDPFLFQVFREAILICYVLLGPWTSQTPMRFQTRGAQAHACQVQKNSPGWEWDVTPEEILDAAYLTKRRREHTSLHIFLKSASYFARKYTKSYPELGIQPVQLWKVKSNLIFIWNHNYSSPPTYSPTLD